MCARDGDPARLGPSTSKQGPLNNRLDSLDYGFGTTREIASSRCGQLDDSSGPLTLGREMPLAGRSMEWPSRSVASNRTTWTRDPTKHEGALRWHSTSRKSKLAPTFARTKARALSLDANSRQGATVGDGQAGALLLAHPLRREQHFGGPYADWMALETCLGGGRRTGYAMLVIRTQLLSH